MKQRWHQRAGLAVVTAALLMSFPWRGLAAPGSALRFDGVDDEVLVPHGAALNAYPLTITAWVKTLENAPVYQGIVSKYPPGGLDGYSLFLYQGRLRAWYFRNSGNYIWNPLDDRLGVDGGAINDGQWHHVAFAVTPTNAVLYVDGHARGLLPWFGTAGAPETNTVPFLIGKFSLSPPYTNSFSGQIDEVTLWKRALTANELNYLKHRRHSGREDELLALWRFNEGTGTIAANTAGPSHSGTLNHGPQWQNSRAAVALEPIAETCIKLDGLNDHLSVPHAPDLNAYPLTISAWIKTPPRLPGFYDGIVSKYVPGSTNGYALFVHSGRLRAWYFGAGGGNVYSGSDGNGVDGGPVADGDWHHVAFVVGPQNGSLYVDGNFRGSLNWSGTAGAPSSAEPLLLGRYPFNSAFLGSIDEVRIWNRALSPAELQSNKNLPLAGTENGLVAYWRLNEGAGTAAADFTGSGHSATLLDGAAWTGSTAFLGDGSSHLFVSPGIPSFFRSYAINTAPEHNAFAVQTRGIIRHFHDFGSVPSPISVSSRMQSALQVAGSGTPIAIKPNAVLNNFNLSSYPASSPQPPGAGSVATISSVTSVEPESGVQLDSVNDLHEAVVTMSHAENGGAFVEDGSDRTLPTRLLHFNGRLLFGDIETTITDVANSPGLSASFAPHYLRNSLQLPAGGARVAAQPSVTFGGGAAFLAHVSTDGTATNVNGTFFPTVPTELETSGLRYLPESITLSSSGATAFGLVLHFPTGFGYQWSESRRVLRTSLEWWGANAKLDATFKPVSNIVFTASQAGETSFYFCEETKPFWMIAPQFEWRVASGEIFVAQAAALRFVRQSEDDELEMQRSSLVNSLAADRISNDGYYRGITAASGAPMVVRADETGGASLTVQALLQPGQYRPHFPYLNRNAGGHIPDLGGFLGIVEDRIDVSASYMTVGGPIPVPYGRDCGSESGCGDFATNGAQVLNFTAQSSRLNFTPEGGLIAYGQIAPTNLTWGYLGGSNYAQRTSNVADGAYHVAGTFLRGDQTAVIDAQRPAALLFTGHGSETNSPYVERPGMPPYADGFANYAGLNFRAPSDGRSIIAERDTDWYALTPRSKYYVRYGGVSGIHEAANFSRDLHLYGYPFHFLSYRLSYLDSGNWESRTDGSLSVPYPSAFSLDFERMKFLCRGSLDSAQLPAGTGPKRLDYWKTDFRPLSIQFKPPLGDPCNLAQRFLALGVETKLPFVPQALHATLGFKTNGNLVTAGDAVAGVDSRFPVPARLELEGPGGASYTLTTAAEGYFNNWETRPGGGAQSGGGGALEPRPEGFYNIIARLRVPFFRDIKVHLHLTPLSNGARLHLMGGWPSEEGLAENRGWRIGSGDYFNTSKFDLLHYGWPDGLTPDEYRISAGEEYRPRAQRDWNGVAKFDYPLAWNPTLRNFAGFADTPVQLPILDVNSRLKEVSPGTVDFDFSQDVTKDLPRIKVLDFARQGYQAFNGPFNSLSNIAFKGLSQTLETSGFRGLQDALQENAEDFFRSILEPAFSDDLLEQLCVGLSNSLAFSGKPSVLQNTVSIVAANQNRLQDAVHQINGMPGEQDSVLGKLHETLVDVEATLHLFIRVIEKKEENGESRRHIVRTLIRKLIDDQSHLLDILPNFQDSLLNSLLEDFEPTLSEIEAQLIRLRDQVRELRGQLGIGTSEFSAALEAANHNSSDFQKYILQAGLAVSNLLESAIGPAGDYFSADPERAKREIRERLIFAFLASPIDAKYQETFRQFLQDKNFLVHELLSVFFDQINRAIRGALADQFTFLDNRFLNFKGGGPLGESILAAKIRGAPTFQGDSLRVIHLDADMKMKLPDDMTFNAYMDIKELNSQSSPVSCIPGGDSATEVALGTKAAPLNWAGVPSKEEGGKPMVLDLDARWTLQGAPPAVQGIGGSLTIRGVGEFKGCSVNYLGAALAVGPTENYFAGKGNVTAVVLEVPVDFRAGIFAGHACSLDALKFVDTNVFQVLTTPGEFSGVYLEFGGGLSLSDILFDPPEGVPGCLLDIRAAISTALYYQGGPRLGTVGARQWISTDVELFCLLKGHADWAVFAALDTAGQLAFGGSVNVCGRIGVCPLCPGGCKAVGIRGVLNDGGMTYFVRY